MKTTIFLLLSCNYFISSDAAKGERIIGGAPAFAGQFPFIAAIYKSTADGQYFCGGSLINQRWILTAGQCVDNAILFTIYLGTTNIKTLDSSGVKLATDEYVLHPDYNPLTLEHDVGLIKLRMDVSYSSYLQAVFLPSQDISPSLNYGVVSSVGWGQTSDDSAELAEELQRVPVDVLENSECKITYGNQITDEMVCVVGNYNEGTCHGDTGTPLVFSYKIRSQYGIASFVSANGCESTDPSGYTRVYPYLSWIRNITDV